LILTAFLALIFGTIEIGLIGAFQLMVDGAAFVAAHEYALGNTSQGAEATTATIFPQVNGAYYFDSNKPTAASVPVGYSTSSRTGGASLIEGSNLQATVHSTSPQGFLAASIASLSKLDIHGSFIEPQSQVGNSQYDIAGAGYTGGSGMTPFFSSVQNVPYNYISQQRMSVCLDPHFSTTCTTTDIAAFGTGEFLDQDNWARSNLGAGSYAGQYTFSVMLCHQQVYARLESSLFTAATTSAELPAQTMSQVVSGSVSANPDLVDVYKWAPLNIGGTSGVYSSALQYGSSNNAFDYSAGCS
jgi:hypothetical protein